MPEKNHIDVSVLTHYLEEHSLPDEERYVFAYTITICNKGEIAARLLTRHWLITDADGKVQEVHGDGVVGEQPYLKPGDCFRYTSAAIIATPVGIMQGDYRLISDEGEQFTAPIAPFTLSIPRVLH